MPEATAAPTAHKRFVYLFQVADELPPHLEPISGPDSDVVFLSWRAPSTDPRSIHYPSSSWTQGRNRLLKEVLGRDYEYFIFADDDVELQLTARGAAAAGHDAQPWRVFEEFLLTERPAVGCTHYSWHLWGGAHDPNQDCQTLRFFDAIVNAFHRDALTTLLPYYDLMDEASETYSQNLLCSLAADLYPGAVVQTNRLVVANTERRRGPEEFILSKPEQFYLESLRDSERRRRFLRQSQGDTARHYLGGSRPEAQAALTRTEDDLAALYDLSHPLWMRRRALLALPASDPFFSPDPNSARAQRWRAMRSRPAPSAAIQSEATRSALTRRVAIAVRAAYVRLGLEHSRLDTLSRALYRTRPTRAGLVQFMRKLPNWIWPSRTWKRWYRDGNAVLTVPESRQSEVIELLAYTLNRLEGSEVVFVDVGCGRGDVLALLHNSALHKRTFSIGIDPVDVRACLLYSGFVSAAISTGAEGYADFFRHEHSDVSSLRRMDPSVVTEDRAAGGDRLYFASAAITQVRDVLRVPAYRLSTILRQFGLEDRILHYVKVDAQGSDLDVVRSLDGMLDRVLFLRLESVVHSGHGPAPLLYEGQTTMAEDRAFLESAGFRLFAISPFGVTPEADLTFVNMRRFAELLPELCV